MKSPDAGYSDVQRTEASEWFVAIRETDVPGPETLQAWLRWLEASEGNREAFQAVERAWQQTAPSLVLAMPGAAELEQDRYDGSVPVVEWRARHASPAAPVAARPARRRRFLFIGAAAASAALVALLAGRPVSEQLQRWMAPEEGEYITATGEDRRLVLADGSRVTLGARSRLAVDFTPQRRLLRLDSGEAYFSVRKDPVRPFTVQALNGSITALGTAFNVRRVGDRVTVAVTEGVVRVADADDATTVPAARQLTFGQDMAGSRQIVSAAAPSSSERARWREGWLVYRDETLGEVLADVGRYTPRHIELRDEDAAQLRFSGAVHKNDIDEWLSALPESFPIELQADGSRLLVRSRPR